MTEEELLKEVNKLHREKERILYEANQLGKQGKKEEARKLIDDYYEREFALVLGENFREECLKNYRNNDVYSFSFV